MTPETEAFLAEMIPAQVAADRELHNGDAGPRIAVWSHNDPVSLFGADLTASTWADVEPAFREVASWFSGSKAWEFEIVHAEASGDLAYTVAIEKSTAVTKGRPISYRLRVTHLYRREDGQWRIIHRHGSGVPEETGRSFVDEAVAAAE